MKTFGKNIWKKHLEKTLVFPFILLCFLMLNTIQAQTTGCIVYDDLTASERTALGISDQEFLAKKSPTSLQLD